MSATDYGLIGHPLGHSLSPFIHQSILAAAALPGTYRLYDIEADRLADTVRRLSRDLAGFNCTIPYKETVIPLLTGLDATARRIRSVNTVFEGIGYNTDYAAFISECPLQAGSRVLILGAGGVSRTMACAAAASGCEIWIAARRPEQARRLAESILRLYPGTRLICPESLEEWRCQAEKDRQNGVGGGWTILNGTPVGLWPQTRAMPLQKSDLSFCDRVYDTIYNPVATGLVLAARSRGILAGSGLGMLFSQALAAQKIWNPTAVFPEAAMRSIRQALARAIVRQFPLKIVLAGFMGSGKSTVGQLLARRLELPFVDLDQEIEQAAGKTIPDIFAADGENAFRSLERQWLQAVLARESSLILATGGGALMADDAQQVLSAAPALVVYLDLSLEDIKARVGSGRGRPMLAEKQSDSWAALYRLRRPRYAALADLTANAGAPPDVVARAICINLGLEGTL